jgi:hypothetical protein
MLTTIASLCRRNSAEQLSADRQQTWTSTVANAVGDSPTIFSVM